MSHGTLLMLVSGIAPLLVAILGIFGALLTYCLNERAKREHEDYARREIKYWELIKAIRGFYTRPPCISLQEQFVLQVSSCWMYCSDEVIHKAYDFVDAVIADGDQCDEKKQRAEAALIAAIRRDSYGRRRGGKTSLTADDFRQIDGVVTRG